MNNNWIIDVLGDLRAFASKNDLPRLARQLDDTLEVAAADVADVQRRERLRVIDGNGPAAGTLFRKARTGADS